MVLLRYFSPSLLKKVPSLTEREVKEANTGVMQAQKEAETGASGKVHGKHNEYTAEERAQIGHYIDSCYYGCVHAHVLMYKHPLEIGPPN